MDTDEAFRLLDTFAECGGNFVDTARIYSDWVPGAERGASEKVIGRWLGSRGVRGQFVVATKGGHPALDNPEWSRLTRKDLVADLSASREALGVERIPVFYLHRDDRRVPVAEVIDMLEDLRSEGYLEVYAASNWTLDRLVGARAYAESRGRDGFAANQPEWSLVRRNPGTRAPDLVAADAAMIAFHEATGLPVVPYSAQAQGYVEKVLASCLDEATRRNYDSPENRTLAENLRQEADALGLTPTQALLRRMAASPFPVIPVVGCRTPEQVTSSACALDGSC